MDERNLVTDSVTAQLNPPDEFDEPTPSDVPVISDRPADGANKSRWIEYVVSLGADENFVSESTEHYDDETAGYITKDALSRTELIELADRLGG